jgi:hypothetical protein
MQLRFAVYSIITDIFLNNTIWTCSVSLCSDIKSLKVTVVCDFAPCSLIEIYRRFRDAYCLHHRPEVESTSER